MTTSDALIDSLVSLRNIGGCDLTTYRAALIAFRRLVMAEFSLAVTLDMQQVQCAMSDTWDD